MKYFLATVTSVLLSVTFFAQDANQWIDRSKNYIKVTDTRTGIFQLTYSQLQSLGFNVNDDPSSFQVFKHGEELAIEVEDGGDGSFDSGDFILFYGQTMDGTSDLEMYINQAEVTNPYYNLYTDSSAYYLTSGAVNAKRIETNNTVTTVAQGYIEHKQQEVLSNQYGLGDEPVTYVFRSEFDAAEGWMGSSTKKGSAISLSALNFSHFKTVNGVQPNLVTRFAGRNKHQHNVSGTVGAQNTLKYDVPDFSGYSIQTDTILWGDSQLQSDQLEVTASIEDVGAETDYVSLVYVDYYYPRDLDISGVGELAFRSSQSIGNNVEVQFRNAASATRVFDVSDINNVKALHHQQSGSDLSVQLKDARSNKSYYLVHPTSFLSPQSIKTVQFKELAQADYLMIYHSEFKQEVERLAAFRETQEGGGYNVLTITQEEVVNLFGYGERTPMANRRFSLYMEENFGAQFLLLFGNGCAANMAASRTYNRKTTFDAAPFDNKDFVMTYGAPGSDIMFSAKKNGTELSPALATGRVPCYNIEEARSYVDKVLLHESVSYDDLWRKDILHMSGGVNEAEGIAFKGYLETVAPKAKTKYLGADVELFSKRTDAAVEFYNISDKVNNGVSLITYFGHSGPNMTEIDIGLVSEDLNGYRNEGKYPFLWINGCQATDVYSASPFRMRTRDWVITDKRGAIGVFGHASFGYTFTLNSYLNDFYEVAFQDSTNFDLTIGEIQQKVIEQFSTGLESNTFYHTHSLQFNYLGDPAIRFFKPEHPDFTISAQDVVISGMSEFEEVVSTSDSFRLKVAVQNWGKAQGDFFTVKVRRLKDGQLVDSVVQVVPTVFYKDTLSFVFSNERDYAGLNLFEIVIDPENEILETSKENNTLQFEYLIPLNGVKLLSPFNYEIVPGETVDLVFQTNEMMSADVINYEIQIDVDKRFNSSNSLYKKAGTIGVVKDYDLSSFEDSTVFYWRVRNLDDVNSTWSTSSFTKVAGKTGWGQFSKSQLSENSLHDIIISSTDSEWYFDEVSSHLIANSAGSQIPEYWLNTNLAVNNQAVVLQGSRGRCTKNGVFIQVFDNETSLPYSPLGFENGNCGEKPRIARSFQNLHSAANQTAFVNYLELVPENDAVLVFTIGNHRGTSWSDEMKDKLKEFGMLEVDSIQSDGQPYVFFGRRGAATPLFEMYGANDSSIVNMDLNFVGNKTSALIRTSKIGSVVSWSEYEHNIGINDNDSVYVSLYGVDALGQKSLVTTFNQVEDTVFDLGGALANSPEIKSLEIQARIVDTIGLKPAQLKDWHVTFDKAPDLAVNPSLVGISSYENMIYQQGEEVVLLYAIHNTNDEVFTDDVILGTRISNLEGVVEYRDTISPIAIGDTLYHEVTFSSKDFVGVNKVSFEVNAERTLEYTFENNFVTHSFEVVPDQGNPLLDITFDGIYIENGGLVSPDVLVELNVVDESAFAFKSDTLGQYLYLKECDSCTEKPIYFSNSIVDWQVASDTSDFKVFIQFEQLVDGDYELLVLAEDAVANTTSDELLRYSFKVLNEKTITHIYPVPNPFREYCRFKFDVTGSEVPKAVNIYIYASSGVLVKTITSDDLGEMKVGENLTTYKYAGDNDSGDLLSNGLYYYKIEFDFGDSGIDYKKTSLDQYEDLVGKIMILR